jgi:hypothetical protein
MTPNLYLEFKLIPTPVLEQHHVAAVDSWTWDDNSEANKRYILRAELELAHRKRDVQVYFLDEPSVKQWYHTDYTLAIQREMQKAMRVDSSLL